MSRKCQLDEMHNMSRYRMVSLALTIAMEDDNDDDVVIAGIKQPRPRVHSLWMSPFLRDRTDNTQRNTLAKLEADFIRLGCVSYFNRTTRMQPHIYKELLELVRPLITYQDTNYRSAISAEERLSITIRYLTRGMEVVGPKYRKVVGLSFNIFRAISQMLLAGIALGIREWKWIEITISLICSFYVFYYWLMPESVRWLLSVGRTEEANTIVTKMAKMNKVTLEKDILEKKDCGKREERRSSIIDILKYWSTARLTIIVWFNWMATAIVYYGICLNTANLPGNPYLNFFVSGCVEIPALLLGIACLDRFGRKKVYILYLLLAGVCCMCSFFIPTDTDWLRTVLVMSGKFGISGAYAIIQIVAAEVFPTVLRNVGMSTSSAFARLGGMVAPQIVYLQIYKDSLPLMVFGGLAIIASMLGLLLQETAGRNLPDSIKDMVKPMELIVGTVTKMKVLNNQPIEGKDTERAIQKDNARRNDLEDSHILYLTHM